MPTNNNHGDRQSGRPQSAATDHAHLRSGGRSHSRAAENGRHSRTRFADRRRKRGRILIALVAICAVEFVIALITSPALQIKHTAIEGITDSSSLTQEEIELTRRVSTLPNGTNWVLAPVGLLKDRLTSLPWIRSAHVGRHLPTDISIIVEPRLPFYALITPAGKFEVTQDNTPIRFQRSNMESHFASFLPKVDICVT